MNIMELLTSGECHIQGYWARMVIYVTEKDEYIYIVRGKSRSGVDYKIVLYEGIDEEKAIEEFMKFEHQ